MSKKGTSKNHKRVYVIVIVILSLVVIVQAAFLLLQFTHEQTTRICTTYGGNAKLQCIEDYIGLTQEKAKEKAEQVGYSPRFFMIDDAERADTDEYAHKIYMIIDDGVVVDGYFGN